MFGIGYLHYLIALLRFFGYLHYLIALFRFFGYKQILSLLCWTTTMLIIQSVGSCIEVITFISVNSANFFDNSGFMSTGVCLWQCCIEFTSGLMSTLHFSGR